MKKVMAGFKAKGFQWPRVVAVGDPTPPYMGYQLPNVAKRRNALLTADS
jgi:hypothetical protein